MKRLAAALLLLTLTAPAAVAAPLQLQLPTPQLRRERTAAIGLGVASAVLLAIGPAIAVSASGSQTGYAGIGLAAVGGVGAMATFYTVTHAAGHDAALRAVERDGAAALDALAQRARRTEVTGIVVTAVGAACFGVGLALTVYSLNGSDRRDSDSGPGSDFPLGIALSVIGDATWLAGSFVWAYGRGMRGGINEARASLRASLTGVSGTF